MSLSRLADEALDRFGEYPALAFEGRQYTNVDQQRAASRLAHVLRRLGITAPHVIFGHTHRSGPWPGDDQAEWRTPAGTQVHNTGSWVYQPHFLSERPHASPYWPGTAVVVEDDGPPRLIRLLGDALGHRELRLPG